MKAVLPLLLTLLAPLTASAAQWHTDYKAALQIAKEEDKPIFVYFSNLESTLARKAKFDQVENLAAQFVLLRADRATNEGSELYRLFEIKSDDGCVIVDRTQQWQYCRFEQKLSSDEIATVMAKTTGAAGKPTYSIELNATTSSTFHEVKPCLS